MFDVDYHRKGENELCTSGKCVCEVDKMNEDKKTIYSDFQFQFSSFKI